LAPRNHADANAAVFQRMNGTFDRYSADFDKDGKTLKVTSADGKTSSNLTYKPTNGGLAGPGRDAGWTARASGAEASGSQLVPAEQPWLPLDPGSALQSITVGRGAGFLANRHSRHVVSWT
jgi:hypothetical protein